MMSALAPSKAKKTTDASKTILRKGYMTENVEKIVSLCVKEVKILNKAGIKCSFKYFNFDTRIAFLEEDPMTEVQLTHNMLLDLEQRIKVYDKSALVGFYVSRKAQSVYNDFELEIDNSELPIQK